MRCARPNTEPVLTREADNWRANTRNLARYRGVVMGRLENAIAFVTGAAGGIGSEICHRFLEEGARVVAVDRDLEATEECSATRWAKGGPVP
ncbi:SDR family NAD(P)-dependent oxidoreductase [Amycolatopsis sp. NPDC049253]|uniref:SDR family NAD(P)-dependent oxidoreductase n=1 Tax=Amycolatopsis sp. NPDC049253 TaxID=3155274 RepID=UPI00341736EF